MQSRNDGSGARWKWRAVAFTGWLLALAATDVAAADFEVSTDNAGGFGSFSEAMQFAEASPGMDRILFEPGFFGTPREISIDRELPVTESLLIQGPGRELLTLWAPPSSGRGAFVATSPSGSGAVTLSVTGLTLRSDPPQGVSRRLFFMREANLHLQGVNLVGDGQELADQSGSALALMDSDLIMEDCLVRGFTSTHRGGAVYVANASNRLVHVARCVFRDNRVVGPIEDIRFPKEGGALFVQSVSVGLPGTRLEILDSEFSGNSATGRGGAISVWHNAWLTLSNSTLSGNSAESGGGIATTRHASIGQPPLMMVHVESSTIVANSASQSGGGISTGNNLRIANSVVAGNQASDPQGQEDTEISIGPEGNDVLASYSLIGDDPGDAPRSSVQVDASAPGTVLFDLDPRLGALASNGGDSRTHALLQDSPLIDAGLAGSEPRNHEVPFPTTDQRGTGFAREVGTAVDIGAFEFVPSGGRGGGGGSGGRGGGGGASGLTALAALLALALAAGCATPYQASGFRGGYSELQLAENVFKVSFQGNAMISANRVADYTLLRSAELAAERGYRYFVIVDSDEYESQGSIYKPQTTNASATASGNQAYGSSTTYGGYVTHYSKPSSVNTIVCYREKPEGFAYSSQDVIRSLREAYRVN